MHSPRPDTQDDSLPAEYGRFVVDLLVARGLSADDLLVGTGLLPAQLAEPGQHITRRQYALLLANALRLSGDPGIAYELGLNSQLTRHGFVGFGLMSCATVGEALAVCRRYLSARVPLFHHRVDTEGDQVVVTLESTQPLGPLREFTYDLTLTELCCLFGRLIHGGDTPASWRSEIWVPYPEPVHYARYRDRLPPFRFNQALPQIRFPADLLTQPIRTANPVAARLALDQCEQELAARPATSLLQRARQQLARQRGHYADLGTLAQNLNVSTRTLKRRLQDAGSSYQKLLDEVRLAQAENLLRQPDLAIEAIAATLGFQDPANFTRAFKRWTGQTPRAWRQR